MLSQDSLERATSQAGITAPPRFLQVTGSTNGVALELAEAGAEEWTVIASGQQTAGRGRLGRSWVSAQGKSLLFSLILRPAVDAARAGLLSLQAAWAMVTACRSGGAVQAKWPNDLVVGERKVGGILPEVSIVGRRIRHMILGVGVNVSMRPEDFPEGVREVATSLAMEGARGDQAELLEEFLVALRGAYSPGDSEWETRVIQQYREVCATLGRRVRATTTTGETIEGTATGITPDGGLVIQHSTGTGRAVTFGELAHLN
jgi:BirA family transcriptional regulator, biotin operon repressor / biotin---[acetyl-CoA-carboxylase] ligase